mgnify:CR=1 FL=1
MKILYLTQSHIPSRSANSIHVMSLASAFIKQGHEVDIVSQNIGTYHDKIDAKTIKHYYNIKKSKLLSIHLCYLPANGFLREFFYFIKVLNLINKKKYGMI